MASGLTPPTKLFDHDSYRVAFVLVWQDLAIDYNVIASEIAILTTNHALPRGVLSSQPHLVICGLRQWQYLLDVE